MKSRLPPLALLCSLTFGCSGTATPIATTGTQGAHPSLNRSAAVTIQVAIPKSSASRRAPSFVSGATESISISIVLKNGTQGPFVGNCPDGFCSQTVQAPLGTDLFRVALYDQQNGKGHLLSSGSRSSDIIAGANNDVSITFDPVVVTANASPYPFVLAGAPTAIPFYVQAVDPSGENVAAPGTYEDGGGNPAALAVAITGANGHLTISGETTFSSPAPSAAPPTSALDYDGSIPNFSYPTLQVSIDQTIISSTVLPIYPHSLVPGTLLVPTSIPVQSAARGLDGNIYFTAYGKSAALVGRYDVATNAVTTYPLLTGSQPEDIVTASDGTLYFIMQGTTTFGQLTPPGTLRQISATFSAHDLVDGVDGNIWFIEGSVADGTIGTLTSSGSITSFTNLPKSYAVVAGPQNRMWFLAFNNYVTQLDSVTAAGQSLTRATVYGSSNLYDFSGLNYTPDGNFYSTPQSARNGGVGGVQAFDAAGNPIPVCSGTDNGVATRVVGQLSDGTLVLVLAYAKPSAGYSAVTPDGGCVAVPGSPLIKERFLIGGLLVRGASAGHAFDIIGNRIYSIVY